MIPPSTALCDGLGPLERTLLELIEAQCRAQEEQASREQLRTIQRAFREALLALPAEEYDWFDIHTRAFKPTVGNAAEASGRAQANGSTQSLPGAAEPTLGEQRQPYFFEFAGPLFERRNLSGVERCAGRRQEGVAGTAARPFAALRRSGSAVPVATHRRSRHPDRHT